MFNSSLKSPTSNCVRKHIALHGAHAHYSSVGLQLTCRIRRGRSVMSPSSRSVSPICHTMSTTRLQLNNSLRVKQPASSVYEV